MKWILDVDVDKKLKRSYIFTNAVLIFLDSIVFIIPVFTGYLVDRITVFHNYDHFFLLCFCFFIFLILKYLGSYFTVIKLDCLCIKITSKIKALCYKNLNQLDAYFYEHHNRGELMTTCTSDIERIRRHLVHNIKTIGKILLTFFCSFIYLMTIHIPFTLLLLIPGVFAGFLSYRFMVKMKPEYEKSRELITLSNDFISDNIEANKVIKTFSLEQDEIKRMQKINQKCVNKEIDNGRLENKFYMQIDFIAHFMNVLFLLVGGYLFIHNKLTMGQLIVFKTSLSSIRAPFFRLSGILNSVQRYIISKNKVIALVSAKPKILLNGTLPLNSLLVPIVFQDVCIAYDNKVILDHLNLEIKPFDTIAFIGKTGSGKSSIVNLLLGFITPFSGKILINGKDYLDYDMKDIRKKIGYVTQSPFLFSDSIYNNIRYGLESITREEAKKYAEFACCEYVDDLKDGIETVIGEKGVGLSGGEKQRLSLARALAVQPDILLLDDITSALDIETEEKINSSINSLKYKSTKIIIASKIVSVMRATCIYVLNEGKIIESGTHQELLANKGYYYELYKMQKGEM